MKLLTACLLLLPLLSAAQDRKMVKKRSKFLLEQFEVLKANDTIRDGAYRKYMLGDDKLLEEGQYANNKRVGHWTFYDEANQPELVYDFTNRKMVLSNRAEPEGSAAQVQEGSRTVSVVLDYGPLYLASSAQVYGIMARAVRFPANLQRAGLTELTFKVLATVSAAGGHYQVIPSSTDKEFLASSREAAHLAFDGVQWVPAVYKDWPVAATYLFKEVTLVAYGVIR